MCDIEREEEGEQRLKLVGDKVGVVIEERLLRTNLVRLRRCWRRSLRRRQRGGGPSKNMLTVDALLLSAFNIYFYYIGTLI